MAKPKVAGIYSITSKHNGKQYVGSSIYIGQRWKEHSNQLKKNKHKSPHLQNHFNKYGVEDLIFEVLEEVIDASLLIEREQHYMDLLNPKFNCCPAAGSTLNLKKEGSCYYEIRNFKTKTTYQTYYFVKGKMVRFTFHSNEKDAIAEVEYLKSLTEEELIEYKKYLKMQVKAKFYTWSEEYGYYKVCFYVNGKNTHFGCYKTQQEAIDRVKYLKALPTEEQIKESARESKLIKNYTYDKKRDKYNVSFYLDRKSKYFGVYNTEQEAINRVKEVKLELGRD